MKTQKKAPYLVKDLEDSLIVAKQLYDQADYAKAAGAYQEILDKAPACYEALNNYGLVKQAMGDIASAEKLYRQAIRVDENQAEAHSNLGNIANMFNRPDKALELYAKAVALKPDYAQAIFNSGVVMHQLNKFDEAIELYKQASQYMPDYVELYCNLGIAYQQLDKTEAALAAFERAVKINPAHAQASHLYSSLSGSATETAPAAYVEGVFDELAEGFEQTLVTDLEYTIPEQLRSMLAAHLAAENFSRTRLLDLGCGTGLVGTAFKDLASTMIGVDISKKMLAETEKKAVYTSLYASDIVGYLRSNQEKYNIVIAADVFVYLGNLQPTFELLATVIENEGYFAFSVEELMAGDETYILQKTGRYAHSLAYLKTLALQYNFDIVEQQQVNIRKEKGKWVQGYCLVLKNSLKNSPKRNR